MPRVYEKIKDRLKIPKIIHLIGTNGKGTTGRFLATALYNLSYNVGHYTSPHILEFNERIWLNGSCADYELLDTAHIELLTLLLKEDADSLSYFEYTTFLALLIYKDMDYIVLEAGLGGEHDATAVFTKTLTLITPIDIDHEAFLGSTIKAIATTKLKAVQKNAIMAMQKHQEVYDVAEKLAIKNALCIKSVERYITDEDKKKIEQIAKNSSLVSYLKENLTLAISALKFLNIEYRVEDFNNAKLYGRLTQINDNILLDVGHNVLAAKAIVKSLKEFKYTLVYNSYKDKNYKEILSVLKPIINDVEIIKITDARGEDICVMQKVLDDMKIKNSRFEKIDTDKKYLVFGSFSVAEAFLKGMSE
ncbi:bifunctional folylpolyglutamate synthase/dihydrofolate synthase [Sulfurimonas sp. SAG-AH-194-C21]|nr:bifunctional folylpolyglutamate synthase/dihydrofolate synthase [Sulfurimonas sp. SAG-AH-194-C21]